MILQPNVIRFHSLFFSASTLRCWNCNSRFNDFCADPYRGDVIPKEENFSTSLNCRGRCSLRTYENRECK